MFTVIKEKHRLEKCKKKVTEMIKNGETFNYSNNFYKYKGNIPDSCLYYEEFKNILKYLEVEGTKETKETIGNNMENVKIKLYSVYNYNKNKMNDLKN
jgi:hypothetical protein